jgi:glycosyltransferase involved in cell wall biosynthesis
LNIPNGGQLGACIAGMRAATSDYLYFLDADDCALPDLVQRLTAAVAREPVKVQFQLEGVNVAREPLQSSFPTFPAGYDAASMRSDNVLMGFYICPPTSGNIDGPATLVLPYKGEVVSMMEPLAQYRVHGRNHSQPDAVTSTVLQAEVNWFHRRWREACMILDVASVPFVRPPLYVLERELMMSALEGRRAVSNALGFSRRLWQTSTPLRHKILLTCWAIALRRLRVTLVTSRRSAANRPRALAWLIAKLRQLQ